MDYSKKDIDFNNVIGLDEAKNYLKEYVILPIEYPQLYKGKRCIEKWTLLYGPPGTGKSYLANAVKSELPKKQNNFVSITLDKFINKSLEERINLLNELFQLARNNKPSVVFIDDMDSFLKYKKEEKEEINKFMNDFFDNIRNAYSNKDNDGIVIFGATNKPWDLEPYIRRRFGRRIYIDLPEANDRKFLIKFFIGNNYNNITEEQFEKMEKLTQGYSRRDIYNIIQDMISESNKKSQQEEYFKYLDKIHLVPCEPNDDGAIQRNKIDFNNSELSVIPCITFENFSLSIQKIKPSIDKKYFELLDNLRKEW